MLKKRHLRPSDHRLHRVRAVQWNPSPAWQFNLIQPNSTIRPTPLPRPGGHNRVQRHAGLPERIILAPARAGAEMAPLRTVVVETSERRLADDKKKSCIGQLSKQMLLYIEIIKVT